MGQVILVWLLNVLNWPVSWMRLPKKKNSLMNQVNWKHGSVQSWPGH